MTMKLVFVGGGKMGEALIGGLLARAWCQPSELGIVELSEERRSELAELWPGVQLVDLDDVTNTDVVIAVKPQHVGDVAAGLAGKGIGRVLSIAAGVTIASLEAGVASADGDPVRVVRAMPNTPALVGAGASAIAAGTAASREDIEWATNVLSSVGTVAVLDEAKLDAVTGLSGSGPAYVFLVAEAMIAAGIEVGLSPEDADALARQTIMGAGQLLSASGEDPAQLRRNVTSPGGTTAEGLAVLEDRGLRDAFAAAIAAATARSVELGKS